MTESIASEDRLHFKTHVESEHPDLLAFRLAVLRDSNAPIDYLEMDLDYAKSFQYLKNQGCLEEDLEDLYKVGRSKWNKWNFNGIEVAQIQQTIISISGFKIYGDWLRVAMCHYTLKNYLVTQRSLFFRKDGFVPRHIEYASAQNLKGIFFTIYPHNSKLAALSKRLQEKGSAPTHNDLIDLSLFKFGGTQFVSGVGQDTFYLAVDKEC